MATAEVCGQGGHVGLLYSNQLVAIQTIETRWLRQRGVRHTRAGEWSNRESYGRRLRARRDGTMPAWRMPRAPLPAPPSKVPIRHRPIRRTTPTPSWTGPGDFGQPAAYDAKTGVAAPLLAGFSLDPARCGGSGADLVPLAGRRADRADRAGRRLRGPGRLCPVRVPGPCPPVLQERCGGLGAAGSRHERGRGGSATRGNGSVRRYAAVASLASTHSGATYNAGIMLLFFALALVLALPRSYGAGVPVPAADAAWRRAGAGLALAASIGELTWVTWEEARFRIRRIRRLRRGGGRRHGADDRPPRRTWRRFLRKESQR